MWEQFYFSILIAGFGGGVVRGLVGFIKHQFAYKSVKFEFYYFFFMTFISGIVGVLAAVATKELGISITGLGAFTPALAFIVGYAGGDFLENLYKIVLKKTSIYELNSCRVAETIKSMTKYFTKFKKPFYSFLVCSLLLASFPISTSAYPAYTANSDLVKSGPYDTAVSGTTNWGSTSGADTRDFITVGQKYRIRQSGTISRVRLCTENKPETMTGFYIRAWRKDGSLYDMVGTSNNIINDIVAGNCTTIDLSTSISGVQEGDYYGYRIEDTGTAYTHFARTSQTGVTTYYVNNAVPDSNDYDWATKSSLASTVMLIELYMTAPQTAFIGDSIIAGHPAHYSFLETTTTTNINSTIEKQFGNLTGYTYQNMGIGSQTTSNISSRFTADIINLKPEIVVIEGGVNDIAGAVAKSTFIANWTSMLDAAQADSSITTIIVLKILPWTNGSTVQMQTRDDWNASLATLAAGYSKAIVVDASSYVGQFRAGGDEGNLWDIQTAYNQDGVHFNQTGHTQIAQAIADNLPKPSATFDNDFSTWNSGDITVNYNLIQTGGSTNSNISQTGTSGIEYSTDGSIWSDATDAGAASEGLTGLTSSASPGDNHIFVWDSSTDLPTTEDSTVYLRIRPNDGTADADDWITSDAFAIDNVAPSAVGVPTFGTIATSSMEITKPVLATENGSGLYQWQARRNEATELGYNATSTNTVTDSDLSPNTQYTYDVKFKDNQSNVSSYGTQASKYTLIQTPTGISFDTVAVNSLTISASGTLSNISTASSGLFFSETSGNGGGANSTWLQVNSYQNTGLSENTQYTFKAMARNGNSTETEYTATSSKYTLVDTPTNLSASSNSNSVSLTVDGFPNDTGGSSGYYFSRSGANSGWIQTNSWTDSGLSCGNSYTYSVKYRNGDGTETSEISTTKSTSGCGGGGMPAGWSNLPIIPTGGFKIFVNSGVGTTTNRIVNLNFNAVSDVKKMAISLTGDFNDASQENYSSIKQIDLCSKMGGLIKNPTCPDGQYTVYVKFYTQYGKASDVVTTKINLATVPAFSKPASIFTKDLRLGSKDNQVKILQQFLNQNGYKLANTSWGSPGNETDFFGSLTFLALAKFQEANKDKAVGIINEKGYLGPITRQFINSSASVTTSETSTQQTQNLPSAIFTIPLYKGLRSENVLRLQKLLATKPEIYPEGLTTGYFGPLTKKAVQKFQLQYEVVNSESDAGFGYVGPKTRAKLQEVFGNKM